MIAPPFVFFALFARTLGPLANAFGVVRMELFQFAGEGVNVLGVNMWVGTAGPVRPLTPRRGVPASEMRRMIFNTSNAQLC